MRAGSDLAGDALDYGNASLFEGSHFIGVVGKQAHFADSQRLENLRGQSELTVIGLEAETFVGLDRIESGVLQFVGLQFSHQADTAAFLLFVHQNAGSRLGDHRESHFELLAAIAAQRPEDVAGQALRMNAHQGRSGSDVAHHQRNGIFLAVVGALPESPLEAVNTKFAPAGREIRRGHSPDRILSAHVFIIDGGLNRRWFRRGRCDEPLKVAMFDRSCSEVAYPARGFRLVC